MASDRAVLVKAFDESRTGVRGLVESGISSVPDLFVHPDPYASAPLAPPGVSIPVVDLSLPTPIAAAAAAEAARSWGFFHLVNHHRALAVPDDYPDRALAAVRAFNELPAADRAAHYGRDTATGVSYYSNMDLYRSPAASWRDSIRVELEPNQRPGPGPVRMPHACLADVPEWDAHASAVGRAVLGLLSEGLGLAPPALEEMSCLEGKVMICHYYPACPEPERTLGIVAHTDPGVLTVLAQDGVGGLQVKHTDEEGKSQWVDVKPVPGALVINVGDLLQTSLHEIDYTCRFMGRQLGMWAGKINGNGVRPRRARESLRRVPHCSLPTPLAAAAVVEAARSWGFFHLVNHHSALGVPDDYPERALAGMRAFN
ncbi:hypothetical protein PR202_ga17301 [Eleusine coracana subsp. coracana]|uniref:Fe2OG dioxygenase domain-containing protein n=1 Tax=Eleusine coracana subsp. coracana TaxID=191504 RepID=A0AAV5CNR2_ELECO|nr:hypothetical protein PR202_ga17301 [Eleusine coracana subsp. coracana]